MTGFLAFLGRTFRPRRNHFRWTLLNNLKMKLSDVRPLYSTYIESMGGRIADEKDGVAGYYGGKEPVTNTSVASKATDTMHRSIEEITKNGMAQTKVFTIGDFGSGNGSASMPLFQSCVKKVKELLGDDQQVHVVYEDQAENDFSLLFTKLRESNSYQSAMSNVFVSSVGRSFFEQCLPANSLNLGFSVMCMHILSTRPSCGLTGAVLQHHGTDSTEREAFRLQAAKDWEQILLQRAAEMKDGARFVAVCICTDDEGSYSGNTNDENGSVYECMQVCLDRMQREGRITAEESKNTFLNQYYRTLTEFSAPFKDENSPVKRAGLSLISIKSESVLCKYRQELLSNAVDPSTFVQKFVDQGIRPWSNYAFLAGLSEKRALEERRDIVDKFYEYLADEVTKDPYSYAQSHVHAHVVFAKN